MKVTHQTDVLRTTRWLGEQYRKSLLAPAARYPAIVDPWHTVGAAGEPAFQNGWRTVPGSDPVAFTKDPLGIIYFRGHLDQAAGSPAGQTVAFQLPDDYRPTGGNIELNFTDAPSGAGTWSGWVEIEDAAGAGTPGGVWADLTAPGSVTLRLDGLRFRADGP